MNMATKKGQGFASNQRSHKTTRIVVLLVGGVLSGALFTIAVAALSFVRSRGIERMPPQIVVEDREKVISTKGIVLPLVVRDDESGLERVVVWVKQGGKAKEVFRQSLGREKVFRRSIEISPAVIELAAGEVVLIIEAADTSIWRNKAQKLLSFTVDNEPPRVDILARSESVSVGEIGMAAYRVTETSLRGSGVRLQYPKDREDTFDGVAGREVDVAFNSPGVFISFFTAPDTCPLGSVVEATDEGENISRQAFSPNCSAVGSGVEHQQIVSPQDIIQRAETLAAGDSSWGEALRGEIANAKSAGNKKEHAAAATISRFLLDTARASDYEEVLKATRRSLSDGRSWRGAARFGVFVQRAGFRDSIVLADAQGVLAKIPLRGVEMMPAQPGFSVVFSPYRGTVRLSRSLGVLGEVVVIDHGAGVSSIFYSLEGRYVEAGAQIDEGQQLGRIGDSGFHFSKALRMQFLLQGVPFDPGVLVDMQRFYSNVELPLNSLRSKFGVSSPRIPKVVAP